MSTILIPVANSHDAIMAAAFANKADCFIVMVYGSRVECELWREKHADLLASREARWYPAERRYRFRNNSAMICLISSEAHMDGFDVDIVVLVGKPMLEHKPEHQVYCCKGIVIDERHGLPPREEVA